MGVGFRGSVSAAGYRQVLDEDGTTVAGLTISSVGTRSHSWVSNATEFEFTGTGGGSGRTVIAEVTGADNGGGPVGTAEVDFNVPSLGSTYLGFNGAALAYNAGVWKYSGRLNAANGGIVDTSLFQTLGTSLSAATWYTLRCDFSPGVVNIYIDGTLRGSGTSYGGGLAARLDVAQGQALMCELPPGTSQVSPILMRNWTCSAVDSFPNA